MNKTKTADLIVGIGVMALGVFVVNYANGLPSQGHGLGSAGYPRILGIFLVFLGLLQTVVALKSRGTIQFRLPKDKREAGMVILAIVITYLYIFLMRHVGFLYLTPIYLFVTMMLFGYRKIVIAAISSIAISVGVFYLFTRVFFIFLPTGTLF